MVIFKGDYEGGAKLEFLYFKIHRSTDYVIKWEAENFIVNLLTTYPYAICQNPHILHSEHFSQALIRIIAHTKIDISSLILMSQVAKDSLSSMITSSTPNNHPQLLKTHNLQTDHPMPLPTHPRRPSPNPTPFHNTLTPTRISTPPTHHRPRQVHPILIPTVPACPSKLSPGRTCCEV